MTVVRPWRLIDDGSTKIRGTLHPAAGAEVLRSETSGISTASAYTPAGTVNLMIVGERNETRREG